MTVDLHGESLPFLGRIHGMETASIKGKNKWRSLHVALEEVQHGESTRHVRLGSFLPGLLYRNLRYINSDNSEVLLREPDGVVASSASDLQSLAGSNRRGGLRAS